MNSGIISILLHQYPYQFDAIQILSTIAFLIDLTLFVIFLPLFLLRLAWFRQQAYEEMAGDISSISLLANLPISWLTITSLVALIVSEAHWGHHAFTIVANVLWWIGAGWMFLTLFFVFCNIINRKLAQSAFISPLIFIPAVGVATLATVGGIISSYAYDISPGMAVPVIIFSFFSSGAGIIFSIMLVTYLFHDLLTHGWPKPMLSASMFIFVGPWGQSATNLQLLGAAAQKYHQFAGYNEGTFLTKTAALPLDVACILIALLLSGIGAVFLILAFCCMFRCAFRKELRWSPMWNAIIFPTGTLTTSFLLFGIEMDSPFFKVVTGILIVFLVIIFFVNLAFSIWQIAMGKLLIAREDPRVKSQLEQEEKSQ